MFEVIYISPSCNQAAEFIDRLMWELRKYDIYNAEIDREHLRLKTDEFIVLAVSIFGNNLGFSHHMVKYYIDDVTGAEFPCEGARDNAMEKLKCLRCSFREDTKEISEEELIDILTEVSNG